MRIGSGVAWVLVLVAATSIGAVTLPHTGAAIMGLVGLALFVVFIRPVNRWGLASRLKNLGLSIVSLFCGAILLTASQLQLHQRLDALKAEDPAGYEAALAAMTPRARDRERERQRTEAERKLAGARLAVEREEAARQAAAEAEAAAERKREAEAAEKREQAAKEETERRSGFHCLSRWDGSHREFVRTIKRQLNDPDSFEHDETRVTPEKAGEHQIMMYFRAKNAFGGTIRALATGRYDHESCAVLSAKIAQ